VRLAGAAGAAAVVVTAAPSGINVAPLVEVAGSDGPVHGGGGGGITTGGRGAFDAFASPAATATTGAAFFAGAEPFFGWLGGGAVCAATFADTEAHDRTAARSSERRMELSAGYHAAR
jgi:hypothetical protein